MFAPTTTIERLDYPKVAIGIHVSNEIEGGFRRKAQNKEPWTVAFIESMEPEDTFYDLGSNVGSYALIAACLGHRVVAFECGAANFAALVNNLALNRVLERVLPICMAVGEKTELQWLNYRDMRPGAASHVLGRSAPGDKPIWFHRQPVLVAPLDKIVAEWRLPPATHIKLDVDGSESLVIRGAEMTIRGAKALMVETKLEEEPQMAEVLQMFGFELVGRFDRRNDQPIGGIVYAWWRRADLGKAAA
jgi:FkbM family methyltransferase